jgi:transcriptional regulator with XRE-family HTH domain
VRQLRRQAEFSFDAFVEETGLGRGYISELERGLVVPSLAVLARLAAALETTMADLVLGDSPREQLFAMARTLAPSDLYRLIATAQKLRPQDAPHDAPFRRLPKGSARNAIRLYSIKPSAGLWSDLQEGCSQEVWVAPPEGVRPRKGSFIAQVMGRALEPSIPDGAWCLFAKPWSSPRAHELGVFVKDAAGDTPEAGGYFMVRPYPASRGRLDEAELGRPCARFVRVLV